MDRKINLSPLREWEEEEKNSKIGLLTLYRMQTQTNPYPTNNYIHRLPKIEDEASNTSKKETLQKQGIDKQNDNIFSHRSVFDKRKKFQSSPKKKKFGNKIRPSQDKKTLLLKEYSFGKTNEEEIRQSWLRSKIFREFIVCQDDRRKTDHKAGNDVLIKIMNSHSSEKKQRKLIYSKRVNTETSETLVQNDRYLFKQKGNTESGTINHSERRNTFLQSQFCRKRKSNFNKKNKNNYACYLKDHFHKNKPNILKNNDLDNYSSNLLTSSLQNMPCEAINEVHGSTPRTDRLKDTIKQYLKSIQRRSFSKKLTILQSI